MGLYNIIVLSFLVVAKNVQHSYGQSCTGNPCNHIDANGVTHPDGQKMCAWAGPESMGKTITHCSPPGAVAAILKNGGKCGCCNTNFPVANGLMNLKTCPPVTKAPSSSPSRSSMPSLRPSRHPSSKPSDNPTDAPSRSSKPSSLPSLRPSRSSTPSRSSEPSSLPSFSPSRSNMPSSQPSSTPSAQPSFSPSNVPSRSSKPSSLPSFTPSRSSMPSLQPSSKPSTKPSSSPSNSPSRSSKPSSHPSLSPSRSSRPSSHPSLSPSKSRMPSSRPSSGPQEADYSYDYKVPFCQFVGTECQSGDLLKGRDTSSGAGTEDQQPNTMYGTCSDGTNSNSMAIQKIVVRYGPVIYTGPPRLLRKGQQATIDVSVQNGGTNDYVDFYSTNDVSVPVWSYIGTLQYSSTSPAPATKTLSIDFTLATTAALQAVRVQFRNGGGSGQPTSSCMGGSGSSNERDDMVFTAA